MTPSATLPRALTSKGCVVNSPTGCGSFSSSEKPRCAAIIHSCNSLPPSRAALRTQSPQPRWPRLWPLVGTVDCAAPAPTAPPRLPYPTGDPPSPPSWRGGTWRSSGGAEHGVGRGGRVPAAGGGPAEADVRGGGRAAAGDGCLGAAASRGGPRGGGSGGAPPPLTEEKAGSVGPLKQLSWPPRRRAGRGRAGSGGNGAAGSQGTSGAAPPGGSPGAEVEPSFRDFAPQEALRPSGAGSETERALEAEVEEAVVEQEQERLQIIRQKSRVPSKKGARAVQGAESLFVREALDTSGLLCDGLSAMIDDSFLRCFNKSESKPWNWNLYLWPMWAVGVLVRNLVLFPLRFLLVIVGLGLYLFFFFLFELTMPKGDRLNWIHRVMVRLMCCCFLASWTGVVRYHGPRPVLKANRVWVANHTSMIDYMVLSSYTPFASIMQIHKGWVGFLQKNCLRCLGCIWFNRSDSKDRVKVAERIQAHVSDTKDKSPLLIFPEGTCVNNEYTVMFKKGAFELGATVCPIAIKYNKIFVDAFWNSRKESFTAHLGQLMTAWALVADVYFLEPQTKLPNETTIEFAARVQDMIAHRANLKVVQWDGYLKYYRPNQRLTEKRREVFGNEMKRHLNGSI